MTEYKKTPEQEIESQLKTTLVELDRLREMLDATNQWPEVTRETAIIREALSQTLSPITDFAEAQRLKERLGEKPSKEFVASELINRYYKPSVIQQGLLAMLLNMPNVPNTYLIQVLENCIIEDLSEFIVNEIGKNG